MTDPEVLEACLRQSTSPDEVRELLMQWRGDAAVSAIRAALYTPAWDRGLLLLLWHATGNASTHIRQNPHRTPEVNRELARWEMNRLLSREDSHQVGAMEALLQLSREGAVPLEGEIVSELDGLLHQGAKRRTLTGHQTHAMRLLVSHPEMPTERLVGYYQNFGPRIPPRERLLLAGHAHTPLPLMRQVLEEVLGGKAESWEARTAFEMARIRLDPVARPRLVRYVQERKDWYSCRMLMDDAREEDFGELLSAWLAAESYHLLRYLKQEGQELLPQLPAAVLAPLLASPEAEVRLLGITLSAHAGRKSREGRKESSASPAALSPSVSPSPPSRSR